MPKELLTLWERAAAIDPTLRLRAPDLPALKRKHVPAVSYSRDMLFSRMAEGRVSLFNNFPVRIRNRQRADLRLLLPKLIRAGFPSSHTARVQTGPARTRRRLNIPELVRRWEGGRAVISVTDLHFRGTGFDRAVDTSALSDFNVLCHDPVSGPDFIHLVEMMTVVASTAGNLTDIHADDCDGSNHCFIGRKLWLAWDRPEGQAAGFQDVDRDEVDGQAAFALDAFLRLPSARWFVVGEGNTLFLPGHMAHKVITLEHYIGVGSFHVALPGCLRSIARWILYDSLDVGPKGLLDEVAAAIVRRIRLLCSAAHSVRERWGLGYLPVAVRRWRKGERLEVRDRLLRNPAFAAVVEAASEASNG